MSLLIRFKNEFAGEDHGTMENHRQILEENKIFFGGQYSKDKNLFTEKRINELRQAEDKRVVFYESGGDGVFVGILNNIYSQAEVKELDRNEIANLIPEYYRDELFEEDSKVTAWLEVSNLIEIFENDIEQYLDNLKLKSDPTKHIKDALKGQSSRFYIDNYNDFEVSTSYESMIVHGLESDTGSDYLPSEENKKKVTQVLQVIREGQQKFRDKILKTYGRSCCISGCKVIYVLEAAHITPYNGPDSNVINNGLCLRSDLHKLWDKYLIAINPDSYKVELSSNLKGTDYEQYEGVQVFSNLQSSEIPTKELLEIQYDKFMKINSDS